MIFKGGTSLSKAYNAIHRFSEDVDLSLDRAQLGFTGDRDPQNPDLSGKKQKVLLDELSAAASGLVAGTVLTALGAAFRNHLDQPFHLSIDPDDPQTLLFAYPALQAVGRSAAYVKPVIRFEFGARGVHIPAEEKQITPYLNDVLPGVLSQPDVSVKVLGIERTFWEKATILHMLCHQDGTKPLADRMSRHYYDMAMLLGHEAKDRALANLALLGDVAHHKAVFFRAARASYETAKPGTLRLRPTGPIEAALRRDYAGMQEMILGVPPSFDDILTRIGAFEAEING